MNACVGTLLARFAVALAAAAATFAIAKPAVIVPYEGPRSGKPADFVTEAFPVKFNLGALRGLKHGDEVELTLPDGIPHTLVLDLLQDHEPGVTSFVAYYKGSPDKLRTIITTGPGGSFGTIATPGADFRLVPANGHDWLIDMTAEQPYLPPIDLKRDSRFPPPTPKSLVPQALQAPEFQEPIVGSNTVAISKATPSQVVVDLLVIYTNGYAARLGSNLTTRLNNLVVAANTAYADSEVGIALRLVHAEQVTYPDLPAVDDGAALDDITPNGPVYPAFANVESVRSAYGADMVALLRDYTGANGASGSGVAWVAGTMGPSAAPYLYSVISGCTTGCDFVFSHELGHNMGNMHDRATAAWQGGGSGSFPYSYGYYSCSGGSQALVCNPFTLICPSQPECNTSRAGTNNFADIMAYFHASTTRNLRFSNPDLILCKGALNILSPCGIAAGQPDAANTALSMNNNRVALSGIRATVVPVTPSVAATTTALASSVNPSLVGQSVTFTATVSSTGGTPAGTVTFSANGAGIASCPSGVTLVGAMATCTTAGLASGANAITANYSGNASFAASTSSTLSQTVSLATPTVSLSALPNPATLGQAVSLHVAVSGALGTPTGAVSFLDGADYVPGCSYVVLSAGAADCVVTGLLLGGHSFSVSYGGSAAYNNAYSATLPFAVQIDPVVPTNVAQAVARATASASSVYSAAYPASAAINGDRAGLNWGNGSGWNDGTASTYPDWLQVDFFGTQTINKVIVYTLQDNVTSPVEPTDSMTFTSYGVVDFTVQGWNGSAWVTLGGVTNNNLVKRTIDFAAFSTSRIRINVTRALGGYSHITEVEAYTPGAIAAAQGSANVALASGGATASESSGGGANFPVSSLIDGDRAGLNWGAGGGWRDSTAYTYPDWVQVAFNGAKTIDRVVVYSLQDVPSAPVQPTDTTTFVSFGATQFSVQVWNGSAWATVADVTGNNLVKRTVTFSPVTTDRIRVNVNATPSNYSRLVEIEAWTASAGTNYALASAGAVATESSGGGASFPVSSLINGDRAGVNWGSGGGWRDSTAYAYPDWVQIDFGATRTLDHVVVYSLQDVPSAPVEPGDTMTFASFGASAFRVEGWNGSAWVTLGTVTGNNLVKRTVSFAPFATTKIRVDIDATPSNYSRLTEIEAWGS